jgi:hypothetical protein
MEGKRKSKLYEQLLIRKELMSFFADAKKPATSKRATRQWKLN